ncbi:hypothetical protein DH2020_013681 [Rehmannia glutinosa]|uniref:Uncharacterized protein n=1 Tax=Rehmannia glutinosa TaxID=99300 RepID=A0ABR0X2Z7_REHGL
MGLLSLLEVSSMPMIQVLLLCLLGAFMATQYLNLLPLHARNSLNKIVFAVFTPCLVFASLAKTVRLEDIISCAGAIYREMVAAAEEENSKEPNKDLEANEKTLLLNGSNAIEDGDAKKQINIERKHSTAVWNQILGIFHQIVDELKAPPVLASIVGFIFGAVSWLRNLIIGDNAPLRVIDDSIVLLGDATIPCITLILGGNLTQGLRKARLGSLTVIAVICVRYIILPVVGIGVVKAASHLGFLPSDPLYHFVLMIQFTLPPAMNIGTMTQLFDVAQEECSVLFLWTYLVSAVALTGWSTVFMWILS